MSESKSVRISRMTKREKDAGKIGGVLNENIAEKALDGMRRLLAGQRVSFDPDAIDRIEGAVARAVGVYRFWQGGSVQNLKPQEIRDQARSTAEVADELLVRLRNVHWEVRTMADAELLNLSASFGLGPELLDSVTRRLEPELLRLREVLNGVATRLDEQEIRKGRKPHIARDAALRDVFQVVRSVAPSMALGEARALVCELLMLAEPSIPVPADKDELQKIMPAN